MDKVKKVEYKCVKCGAEDKLKSWINDPPPPSMINCWKCGAGFGKEQQEMLMTGNGMALTGGAPPLVMH